MSNIKLNDTNEINLSTLIDTRLLIQANSGGGKSWLIRKILEESHGKVQQIVLDLEGEFGTLREKYDYILAGVDGDTPAEPKSAAMLARRLLELNVSAIINLYELDALDRKRFVKLFLDSMINAKKELWHPCLVIIDEAHVFCPEKGQSEAAGSVIDLATRGRKRGFAAVLATQRLSKLHKDAAAECNNKLIGRTGLDIDRKRASEELGFTSKEQELSLRTLDAGEFFAFGPAISNEVIKIKVGSVNTSHPKAGSRILTGAPVPPTEKIKSLLNKLSDLPQAAEKEARDIDVLTKENLEMKRQIIELKRDKPKEDPEKFVGQTKRIWYQKGYEDAKKHTERDLREWKKTTTGILGIIKRFSSEIEAVYIPEEQEEESNGLPLPKDFQQLQDTVVQLPLVKIETQENTQPLPLAPRKIYAFLCKNSDREFSRIQIAAVTGYSVKSGGFKNALSMLNAKGLVRNYNGNVRVVTVVPALIGDVPEEEYSPQLWMDKLPLAPKRIYEYLWNHPTDELSRKEIGEITNYSPTSGGFKNALSKLNSLGLIQRMDTGRIRLNPDLLSL